MFCGIGINRFRETAVYGQIGLFIAIKAQLIHDDGSLNRSFANAAQYGPVAHLKWQRRTDLYTENPVLRLEQGHFIPELLGV